MHDKGNLILSRKVGEAIQIGDDVTLTIVRIANGQVRLAIVAPKEVIVLRSELRDADVRADGDSLYLGGPGREGKPCD